MNQEEFGINAALTARRNERGVMRVVKLAEKVVDVQDCLTLAQVATTLGHVDIESRLIDDGIFALNGLPYLHFLDCGYFVIGAGREVLLTAEGQAWFARRYPATPAAVAAASAGPQ
jgi:hypothetical protein